MPLGMTLKSHTLRHAYIYILIYISTERGIGYGMLQSKQEFAK
jgi:hypothetical protein